MNEEIKNRWLVKLRSGDYVQGKSKLVQRDHLGNEMYCCLGVLCEVAVEDGVIERSVGSREGYLGEFHGGDMVQNGVLPLKVARWAGLMSRTGTLSWPIEVEGKDESARIDEMDFESYLDLSELNDEGGYSFDQIADVIEEQL